MNSKVFERAMFKAESKPRKADSGIMQGFDDEEPEDIEENDEEMMEEVSRRSPNSPEILMNNLRGDMRSVEARYQELAEMVGEEAAMETPPEVLAMLQPQLMAQQAPMGIGALPAQGVTPPQMPPAAAPMPTPPQMPMSQGEMPPPQNFFLGGLAKKIREAAETARANPPAQTNPSGFLGGFAPSGLRATNPSGFLGGFSGIRQALNFDPAAYLAANPDVADKTRWSGTPLQHYMQYGRFEGRPYTGKTDGPRFMASGGIASLPQSGVNYNQGMSYDGPLESGANYIQGAGRNGDTLTAHMTPEQHQVLSMMGGGSTTNPKTGLPEHYMGAGAVTNLLQRIQPYTQAANQYIGSRMAPVLTPPTMQQGRSTMGTFLPKTVEGMELTYPTLTQRIGMATEPARNYIASIPGYQKAGAALATIPGGKMVMDAMGGGERVPTMPLQADGSDVPMVIGAGPGGERTYTQPPLPQKVEAPVVAAPTKLEEETTVPTAPKTVEELVEKQAKGDKKNRLEAYMEENLPIFEKYMGGDKEASQIQALLLLADAGLEYATKPARTGMMALANAFKRVPAGLSQIAAQEQARKSQIKGAALTSGLQTIAAEDKATSLLQRELLKKAVASGEVTPTDRGAGLTSYTNKQCEDKGMKIDPTVVNSFLQSRTTPQPVKDKDGVVVGFNNPYARVLPPSQTINTDKNTREQLFRDLGNIDRAIATMDGTAKDIENAFGPQSFLSNFKNNVLVPVLPLNPNLVTADARAKVLSSINVASKAIARAGDTGNIAVAEQANAVKTLGDAASPNAFFSNPETALQAWMTARTNLLNQKFIIANQLGFIDQDVVFDTPNLGTKNDPIPADKLSYIYDLAKTNPKGTVYIRDNQGKVSPAPLSTIKQ